MAEQTKKLNLYLVTRTDSGDYDEYSSFIVCCETEQEARETYPTTPDYTYNRELQAWRNEQAALCSESTKIFGHVRYFGKYPDRHKGPWIYGKDIGSLEVENIGIASSKFIKKDVLLASFHAG